MKVSKMREAVGILIIVFVFGFLFVIGWAAYGAQSLIAWGMTFLLTSAITLSAWLIEG